MNNQSDLNPANAKPSHDKAGTQSGSAATVTDAGIGCGALLGSFFDSFGSFALEEEYLKYESNGAEYRVPKSVVKQALPLLTLWSDSGLQTLLDSSPARKRFLESQNGIQ